MGHLIAALLIAGLLVGCSSSCSLPGFLLGDWESSDVGTLTFNSTSFGPYTVALFGDYYFECYSQVGTKFVVRSTQTKHLLGNDQYFYLCLDLRYQSDNKYIYYIHTSTESAAGNQRVKIVQASQTPGVICDDVRPDYTYHMLLKIGSESTEKVTCPSWFLATFNYTVSAANCASTSGTTCNDNTIVSYNITLCSYPILLSTEGSVSCMYHTSIGSTNYLTFYNLDTVPQYKFICMVSNTTDSTILATVAPNSCGDSQTPIGAPQLEFYIQDTCPIPISTLAPVKNSAGSVSSVIGLLFGLVFLAKTLRY